MEVWRAARLKRFSLPDGGIFRKAGERMPELTRKQKRALLTAGVSAGVYLSFKYLLPLFIPFIAAYVIALLLRPLAVWLERRLTFRVWNRRVRAPVGVIGGVELVLVLALLGAAFFAGARRLFMEANQLVNAAPGWIRSFDEWLTGLCHGIEVFCRLREGVLVSIMQEVLLGMAEAFKTVAMPNLVFNSVSVFLSFIKIVVFVVILFIASILSLQEMDELRERRWHSVFHREFSLLRRRLTLTGSAWLKTQAALLFLTTCLCILTLIAIKNPYYITVGIGIGVFDALPIFGTGTILIPWGLLLLLQKKWYQGLMLLGLYLICYFMREFLEARMMGRKMGLSPLETLASMYAGLKLFGALGVILGPVGLLLIEDLVEEYEREE
jgi:sporulation integral membrane protein YtvI